MNLKQAYLTKNDCYKAGKTITVKKLMLHSTGANNPKISRYVQPDDGIIGDNPNNNDWNRSGVEKCVHAFIGLDKKGLVKTYQTLPWNRRAWHAGGDANNTHIGVEICEDDLKDGEYFKAVYEEAVELFAYLCEKYDLTEKDIITHSEGHDKGIASNHGDVMHWFPKHGKSMNTFRADVKKELNGTDKATPKKTTKSSKSIDALAKEVIDGEHGSGDAREKSLGANYKAVQERVNEILETKSKSTPAVKSAPKDTNTPAVKPVATPAKATKSKSIDTLAKEVINGEHGSGDAREKSLGANYKAVQERVNTLLQPKKGKTISQLADEVNKGIHGTGRERMLSLGSNYAAVQMEVNKRNR